MTRYPIATPIASATPSRHRSSDSYETKRNGTDGESGCERGNLYVSDRAREQKPSSLAYLTPCRYCGTEVYVAICRDGCWRSFETARVPAAPHNVWAWRKTYGMEEQELVGGHTLHFCAEYGHVKHTVGAIR